MARSFSIIIISSIISLSHFANAEATFVGPSYEHIRQEGRVYVRCDDGVNYSYGSYWCEGAYTNPTDAAYFKTSLGSEAHHVTLHFESKKSTFEDTWKLNRLTHKTFLPIRIAGGSGVLREGFNLIKYSIFNRKELLLEEGQFQSELVIPPVRQCAPLHIRSVDMSDCSSAAAACRHLNNPRRECEP